MLASTQSEPTAAAHVHCTAGGAWIKLQTGCSHCALIFQFPLGKEEQGKLMLGHSCAHTDRLGAAPERGAGTCVPLRSSVLLV